jgi:glycerophosphoryl diester phosphodiesterase
VRRAHDAGLRVLPWTVTTERELSAVAATGVDGVITDVCRGVADDA